MLTGLMSSRNSPTLTLDVRSRRAERRAAGLAVAAGVCAVLLLEPSGMNAIAGAVCLAAMGFGLWRAGWIGSRHRIVGLRWLADGRWLLDDSRANSVPAELAGDTCLAREALWLRWRTLRGRRRSMLLAPGDLPAGELRALAVRLRIEALERALPDTRRR